MYKERLHAYFQDHLGELLEDISTLVPINSEDMEPEAGMPFGRGPAQCLEAAGQIMKRYGFAVKNYDNYVVTADIGPVPRKLDILAHLDVVPAGEGWTVTEPFRAKIQDGRIYGRGTADDKGPAVCALYAIRAIQELGIPLRSGVRLILGSNEERGSGDLRYYYQKEKSAPMSFSPDADFPVINVEKGGLFAGFHSNTAAPSALPRLVKLQSGIRGNIVPDRATAMIEGFTLPEIQSAANRFMEQCAVTVTCVRHGEAVCVTVEGKTAHASTPERGENAITAMLELLASLPLAESETRDQLIALHKLFPHGDFHGKALSVDLEDAVSGKTTLSLNILQFEDGQFSGLFDCRACLAATDENTTDVVYGKLKENGFLPDSEDRGMYPPHHVPEESELVQSLLRAYSEITGKEGKPIAIGGGTYVHNIENGVAFGCAVEDVDNHMHGADEFMEIDMILQSCEIFAQAILNLCG